MLCIRHVLLVFHRRISPSYWQVVVIAVIAPLGGTFMDTSALITCTRNFPSERGSVIGIVKACIGASPIRLFSPSFQGVLGSVLLPSLTDTHRDA